MAAEPTLNCAEVAAHIARWLKGYCETAKLGGFVVGVSGGIDSAVSSTLCAQAGLEVQALNLPIHQAQEQYALANQHIAWLETHYPNVRGVEVDLSQPFDSLSSSLPEEIRDPLTLANSRSRLRMTTLYAFASHHKLLVAGTGNKVEDLGIGFFTKYGDGGVDLSPIADLLKSEVYALGRYLGVARSIQQAPPTDGLWPDHRTDEAQIGASYDELEWAMSVEGTGVDEAAFSERQSKVLSIYRRLHAANRHKMQSIPICKIPLELRKA